MEAKEAARGRQVLLIDPDADLAQVVEAILADEGSFQIVALTSHDVIGARWTARLRSQRPSRAEAYDAGAVALGSPLRPVRA